MSRKQYPKKPLDKPNIKIYVQTSPSPIEQCTQAALRYAKRIKKMFNVVGTVCSLVVKAAAIAATFEMAFPKEAGTSCPAIIQKEWLELEDVSKETEGYKAADQIFWSQHYGTLPYGYRIPPHATALKQEWWGYVELVRECKRDLEKKERSFLP